MKDVVVADEFVDAYSVVMRCVGQYQTRTVGRSVEGVVEGGGVMERERACCVGFRSARDVVRRGVIENARVCEAHECGEAGWEAVKRRGHCDVGVRTIVVVRS